MRGIAPLSASPSLQGSYRGWGSSLRLPVQTSFRKARHSLDPAPKAFSELALWDAHRLGPCAKPEGQIKGPAAAFVGLGTNGTGRGPPEGLPTPLCLRILNSRACSAETTWPCRSRHLLLSAPGWQPSPLPLGTKGIAPCESRHGVPLLARRAVRRCPSRATALNTGSLASPHPASCLNYCSVKPKPS